MRRITVDEQREILQKLASSRWGADMMLADAVCYGGQLKEYRDAEKYVRLAIEAFPEDIRKEYDAEIRKQKADVLRAQADKIEKGTAVG